MSGGASAERLDEARVRALLVETRSAKETAELLGIHPARLSHWLNRACRRAWWVALKASWKSARVDERRARRRREPSTEAVDPSLVRRLIEETWSVRETAELLRVDENRLGRILRSAEHAAWWREAKARFKRDRAAARKRRWRARARQRELRGVTADAGHAAFVEAEERWLLPVPRRAVPRRKPRDPLGPGAARFSEKQVMDALAAAKSVGGAARALGVSTTWLSTYLNRPRRKARWRRLKKAWSRERAAERARRKRGAVAREMSKSG